MSREIIKEIINSGLNAECVSSKTIFMLILKFRNLSCDIFDPQIIYNILEFNLLKNIYEYEHFVIIKEMLLKAIENKNLRFINIIVDYVLNILNEKNKDFKFGKQVFEVVRMSNDESIINRFSGLCLSNSESLIKEIKKAYTENDHCIFGSILTFRYCELLRFRNYDVIENSFNFEVRNETGYKIIREIFGGALSQNKLGNLNRNIYKIQIKFVLTVLYKSINKDCLIELRKWSSLSVPYRRKREIINEVMDEIREKYY